MELDERVYNLGKELAVMKAEYDHLNEALEINLKAIERRMSEFDRSLNKKFDFIGNIASFARKMIAIPDALYALFGAGYLGYSGARSYDKKNKNGH